MKINIKVIGTIPKQTIMFVKFSALLVSVTKCTSSGTYFKDIEQFCSQFKKQKEINVTMEIISEHGKEFQ